MTIFSLTHGSKYDIVATFNRRRYADVVMEQSVYFTFWIPRLAPPELPLIGAALTQRLTPARPVYINDAGFVVVESFEAEFNTVVAERIILRTLHNLRAERIERR